MSDGNSLVENKEKFRQAFEEEARELLGELETSLLELERNPGDIELVSRVFRAMHTIKGSGAMFGFDAIAEFTHEVETVFDLVREGSIPVTKVLIDSALAARDHIRALLEDPHEGKGVDPAVGTQIVQALRALSHDPVSSAPNSPSAAMPARQTEETCKAMTVRVQFRPPNDIGLRGLDPLRLLDDLRSLGDCEIKANVESIPPLDDLNGENCYLGWDITLRTSLGLNAVKDVFLFIQDDSDLRIEVVEKLEPELAEMRPAKPQQAKCSVEESGTSIRVASEKLDKLVDLVGELVTIQSLLSETAPNFKKTKIPMIAEAVERLTIELRDTAMGIRMLPIGTTFSRFKRLVRDLSKELEKEIELVTDGGETELDKTVIEKLGDPLVHILRNCMDHGIEAPDDRVAAGKPRVGTIKLSASHSGAYVLIKVEDDGRGIDPDLIRAKAIEKGLIPADASLTEKEILSLIFAPGFSTAKTVTNLSGRGVGMDVVKRGLESLGGSIEIVSQKGIGASLTAKIPLTLAIIEGLLVKIGTEKFIIPLAVVEECVDLENDDNRHPRGNLATVRGQLVPYIRLRDHFAIDGARPRSEQIVIVSMDNQRTGFVVDQVIGEHQTVIKNLGTLFKRIEGVSGGTILGDGTVALILDVGKLIQTVEFEETYNARRA